ncbi:MAG: hypothetical protein KDI01_02910 [Halioglobus sp.]|nr:hypothetical protein [Halioglobus sp.]
MIRTQETHSEDFTDSGCGYIRDTGLRCADTCPSDWAVGSDEAGERIYTAASLTDYLQRDCA